MNEKCSDETKKAAAEFVDALATRVAAVLVAEIEERGKNEAEAELPDTGGQEEAAIKKSDGEADEKK
jgi:hypothetical protein